MYHRPPYSGRSKIAALAWNLPGPKRIGGISFIEQVVKHVTVLLMALKRPLSKPRFLANYKRF